MGVPRALRRTAVISVVCLGAVVSPADAATAEEEIDPRLRYQLLSIAAEASRACAWGDREFGAHLLQRRERLAERMIGRDLTDAGDLAQIRKRARRIFRAEGCGSQAISNLMATVRAVETD